MDLHLQTYLDGSWHRAAVLEFPRARFPALDLQGSERRLRAWGLL